MAEYNNSECRNIANIRKRWLVGELRTSVNGGGPTPIVASELLATNAPGYDLDQLQANRAAPKSLGVSRSPTSLRWGIKPIVFKKLRTTGRLPKSPDVIGRGTPPLSRPDKCQSNVGGVVKIDLSDEPSGPTYAI